MLRESKRAKAGFIWFYLVSISRQEAGRVGPDLLLRKGADEPRLHGCLQTTVTALQSGLLPPLHPLPVRVEPCKPRGLPGKKEWEHRMGRGKEEERARQTHHWEWLCPRRAHSCLQKPLLRPLFLTFFQSRGALQSHIMKERTLGRTRSRSFTDKLFEMKNKKETRLSTPSAWQPSHPPGAPFMPIDARPESCFTRGASTCPRCLCWVPNGAHQGQRPAVPSLQMDSREHLQLSSEGAKAQKSEVTCKPQTELRSKPSVATASMPAPWQTVLISPGQGFRPDDPAGGPFWAWWVPSSPTQLWRPSMSRILPDVPGGQNHLQWRVTRWTPDPATPQPSSLQLLLSAPSL